MKKFVTIVLSMNTTVVRRVVKQLGGDSMSRALSRSQVYDAALIAVVVITMLIINMLLATNNL